MSKSFKGEAKAQARAVQARRAERRSKRNANENHSHFRGKNDPVDANPQASQRWPLGWRA
jgi:hypothetical protein